MRMLDKQSKTALNRTRRQDLISEQPWDRAIQMVLDGSAVMAATPRGLYTRSGISNVDGPVAIDGETWTVFHSCDQPSDNGDAPKRNPY